MNKNLLPIKTSIFRNKLSKILEQLQKDKDTLPQQTREAIIAEAVRLLSLFYKTIQSAGFKPIAAVPGTKPEHEDYNSNFQSISDDIDILFAELENLEGVVLEQFNLFATQSNRINARIKRLASRITDYNLFSKLPIKNSLFFTDSFIDTSKIEVSSPLLNAAQCDLEPTEGIVTLPADQGATVSIPLTIKPLINSNSNGRIGNNEELNSQLNDNVQVILDNNPDTWFEYERVVQVDDGVSLILDLTVNLGTEQIVNHIRINPNNFGTKTEIEISEISTSLDGLIYKSIKDEIPISGFTVEDEENVFKLAAATSKFAGQGIFTFTPRFTKYVRFTLRQISPYLIDTVQGKQLRYAIGIRDVEVKRIAYQATGEIVSTVFDVGSEIKKVILRVNQTPVKVSELASIKHQISLDDGNSWLDIQPIESTGVINTPTKAAEVISVNTEDESAVTTAAPATTIRWKGILQRHDEGFTEGSTTFAESITETAELKSIPLTQPWVLTLDNSPIVGSVALLDVNFGSRGNQIFKHIVGVGNGGKIRFNLPWVDLRLDKAKALGGSGYAVVYSDILRVFVNGEEWTRTGDLSVAGPTDKVWEYFTRGNLTNNTDSVLEFGDGVEGASPVQGALIEIMFTDERLYPVSKQAHTSDILFPTGNDKSSITVYRRGAVLQNTVEVSKETNIHRLSNRNIVIDTDRPITFTNDDGVFTNRIAFRNGLASPSGELLADGDWSIDIEKGIIYSFKRTDTTPGVVTYYYQDQEELSNTQWDWGDDNPVHHSVTIKNEGWVPNKVTGFLALSGIKKISLRDLAVVEGTLQFIPSVAFISSNNPFIQEVPFIDGTSELSTVIKTEQVIPTLTPISSVASFTTNVPVIADVKFAVSFTNLDLFTTEVGSLIAVNSAGEYYVDRSTGIISVYTTAAVTDAGSVSFYTSDPANIPVGAFSVDYKNGEIYLQRALPSDVVISYQYADYFIKYNIARVVPDTDWTLDAVNKTVLIKSNETNLRSRIPNIAGTNLIRPATYQVNYKYIASTRKNIQDLKSFFSPVLKDYALQIVTSELL